nr:hypothetical protein [Tanacetum cinerariifolium]
MIPEPGDTNREVPINETFYVKTDDELTEKELKQIEADDQAIQTILLGLPEDIYIAVDSYETAQEIWLRDQQMMKGSDIGIQQKKAKLFNEWERKDCQQSQVLNNLQPEWSRHVTIVHQTKDLHTADYTQLYDFLKYNQKEVIQNEIQNPRVQNVRNQNGLIGVPGNANQNSSGNGNLVAARAEGNAAGHNGIQLQAEEFDLMVAAADLDEIEEVNENYILMANLQQASTSGLRLSYSNPFLNQYIELLEPIPEPHQVPQNDNNVIFEVTSMEQSGKIVKQHPANFEETHALYDSLYQILAIKVEKVNTVNRKLKETNAELTTELARFKNQKKCFEISQERYDKLERCYQKSVYQEQCLSKKINALHLSSDKQIMTLNEEISDLNKQLSKEKSIVSFLLEEKKKLKSDFKTREDELIDKQIQLE